MLIASLIKEGGCDSMRMLVAATRRREEDVLVAGA